MSSCSLEKFKNELDKFFGEINDRPLVKKNYPSTWPGYNKFENLVPQFLKKENSCSLNRDFLYENNI